MRDEAPVVMQEIDHRLFVFGCLNFCACVRRAAAGLSAWRDRKPEFTRTEEETGHAACHSSAGKLVWLVPTIESSGPKMNS